MSDTPPILTMPEELENIDPAKWQEIFDMIRTLPLNQLHHQQIRRLHEKTNPTLDDIRNCIAIVFEYLNRIDIPEFIQKLKNCFGGAHTVDEFSGSEKLAYLNLQLLGVHSMRIAQGGVIDDSKYLSTRGLFEGIFVRAGNTDGRTILEGADITDIDSFTKLLEVVLQDPKCLQVATMYELDLLGKITTKFLQNPVPSLKLTPIEAILVSLSGAEAMNYAYDYNE